METVNVTDSKTVNVTEMVEKALALHERIDRLGRVTTKMAWQLGRVLIDIRAARKLEGKGKWQESFKRNHGQRYDDGTLIPDGDLAVMSIETARRYIRLAEHFRDLRQVPDVPLCDAYSRAGILVHGWTKAQQAIGEVKMLAEKLERLADDLRKARNRYEDAWESVYESTEDPDDTEGWDFARRQFDEALKKVHTALHAAKYRRNEDGKREVVGSGLDDPGLPQW